MANNLTALQPVLFSVAQEIAAEPFGAVSAINTNFDSKGVAVGDKVKVPVAPMAANADFTPAATSSTGADRTASAVEIEITKSRKQSMYLSGEMEASLTNGGNTQEWIRQNVGQMMRALRNEAEADAVTAIKVGASRAVGTAGTNPFASALTPLADVRKVLRDNGAPMADLQFVGDTTSEANLLKLGVVLDASIAGGDAERRDGILRRQYGFNMRTSGGVSVHTKGTGASYLLNGAVATGATAFTVDTGSGTIVAGDVITVASDNNKYVVNTALASNVLSIGKPGKLSAGADNAAITVGNDYTPNLAFERNAVVGVMRPPAFPQNATITQTLISDQYGMTYLLLDIQQYGQRTWELHLAWGFKVVQPEFVATLLG